MPVFRRQMHRLQPRFVLHVEKGPILEQFLHRHRISGLRNVTPFSGVDLGNELIDLRFGEALS